MFATTALRTASGAIVWAAHFTVIYGTTALACARGSASAVPWVIALATLVGVVIAAAIVVRAYPRRDDFTQWLAAAVAATAIVAMVWEALAALLAGPCG